MSSAASTSPGDVTVRPATLEDGPAVAEVHIRARRAAVPLMPPPVHDDAETAAWLLARVAGGDEVWVATVAGKVVGYARLGGDWLDDLYVVPSHTGRGIGRMLLDVVKAVRPEGFALWVFESNEPARRFYLRHGLVELERTDGSANEERAPDIRMAWPGLDPVRHLRGQIDELDAELAALLSRRAALSAAVQAHKPVGGHAGRDPEREAHIVARMAERAPRLGREALGRIMHEVITASLDAAERRQEQDGAMSHPLGDEITTFLHAANPAVIGTVRPDGQPVTVATWYLLDGERILVNMDAGRRRLDYLREDPRVSLTVLSEDDWHTHVSVQGRIVEWRDDEHLSDIDRLARRYGRDRYPNRTRARISAWIEVERVHTWGRRFRH